MWVRNCRRALCAALVFFAVPVSVMAQEKITLTVDDAVQRATGSNVNIQRQKLVLEELEKTKSVSWNNLIPTVGISGNLGVPYRNETTDFQFSWTGSLSLSLTPSIYTTMQNAILQYENGELTYAQTLRSIEFSVRQAFFGLLYSQENIRRLRQNLDTAKRQYEQSLAQYNLGQRSELDMLQSRVNYESLIPSLEDTQIAYMNSLATFKQLIGIPQDTDVEISGSLEESSRLNDVYLDYDVDNAPTVRIAQKSLDIAHNNLLATRFAAWGPRITLGFSYGNSITRMSQKYIDDQNKKIDDGNKQIDDLNSILPQVAAGLGLKHQDHIRQPDWTDGSAALSLGISIPLDGYLPWSSGARSISQAQTNIKSAELSLKDTKTTVQVQVANYLAQIRQIKSQLATLEGTIDLSQRNYNMTQQAYNSGARDLLTLQSAADALLMSHVNYAAAQYSLIVAFLNLENTIGVPFGTLGK